MASNLQEPQTTYQITSGGGTVGLADQRVLIIGEGAGTATAGEVVKNVSLAEVDTLLGEYSLVSLAYKRFRKYNESTVVDILPMVMPAAGTVADGGITTTGTATENGTLTFEIGDDDFSYSVTVLDTETAAEIAIKIAAAIEAEDYPFTAAVDGVDDTLVGVDFDIKGEVGNKLTTRITSDRIAGVEFTVQAFGSGAGSFDTTDILDQLDERYQTVVFDNAMDLDDLVEWLEERFNTENIVMDGIAVGMINKAYADLLVDMNASNSKILTVLCNPDEMKINAIPLIAAAEFAAKRSLRLTEGAVIGDLVLEAQEAYGGIEKASLPYHNTPMSYRQPILKLTLAQTNAMYDAGGSLIIPGTSGTVLGRVVTTYKTDLSGQEDLNFKFLNSIDTASAIREYLFNNTKSEFGQTRATSGDLVAGVTMTNEMSVKSYIVGLHEDLAEFALAQAGKDALKSFVRTLTVSLDITTGVYSIYAPVAIVSQLRGINGTIPISYQYS